MATEKKVPVFIGRKITLERHDKPAVVLHPGRNHVDADVAEHPFVKAHTVDGSEDAATADNELHAKIAELLAKVEEQAAVIQAYEAEAATTKKK